MDALNEMTALNASVGAEAGQPFTKSNTTIINDNDSDFNSFDEINDLCDIDESYLHTVSMTELFDSTYKRKLNEIIEQARGFKKSKQRDVR